MQSVNLSEAEKMEVTILVDNYSDLLLQDTDAARRMKVMPPQAPMAEHGLACLVSVYAGDEKHTILMDAGITGTCLLHNAGLLPESMGVKTGAIEHQVASVEAVVLSHGHFDHYAGLPKYLVRTGKRLPLVVHPGAFVERRIKFGPDFTVPMHCTGWMAINRFAQAMPDQFILNSVGTTYQFGG